ncbi:HNH homing endonuclease [Bacillus phage 031MP004]|nr:HNH homing endonuclease [Bacillus phage 031MP004]
MGKKILEFDIIDLGCFELKGVDSVPTLRKGRRVVKATRHIYEECFGDVPEGHIVVHTCQNQYCINPEHLATQSKSEAAKELTFKRLIKAMDIKEPSEGDVRLAKHLMSDKGMSIFDVANLMGYAPDKLKSAME